MLLLTALAVIAEDRTEGGSVFTWIKELFEKETIHLCPEVKGQVLDNGKPIEGLTIFRELIYNDHDPVKDFTQTDADGGFSFPERLIKKSPFKMDITHHQTLQLIAILDEYKNYRPDTKQTVYPLWNVTHNTVKPAKDFFEKLNTLDCDINNKEFYFAFHYDEFSQVDEKYRYKYSGTTICRWDNDFKLYGEVER